MALPRALTRLATVSSSVLNLSTEGQYLEEAALDTFGKCQRKVFPLLHKIINLSKFGSIGQRSCKRKNNTLVDERGRLQARSLCLNYEIYSFYIAPCNGLRGAVAQYAANQNRNNGANPLLFSISALGYLRSVTQQTEPTALCPIRRTKHHGKVC